MPEQAISRRRFLAAAGLAGIGMAAAPLSGLGATARGASLRAAVGAGASGAGRTAAALQAAPNFAFDAMFTAYGNNTDPSVLRWTGADSTYSVPLPDGRTAWIFSDTFLGYVFWNPDRATWSRPQDALLVNNTYVLQAAGRLELTDTLYGGTPAAPTAFIVPPEHDATWYWMGDATVEGNRLRQLCVRWRSTGSGFLQIAEVGVDLATLALPSLEVVSIDPLPGAYTVLQSSGIGVSYAAAIREQDDATYIFGVEDAGFTKYLHLARAAAGDIGGPWVYYAGGGRWSADPQESARLERPDGSQIDNLSNEIGVSRFGPQYALIDQDYQIGDNVLLYTASRPGGPWTNQGSVYTCPEHAYYQSRVTGPVFPYNSKQHEQFSSRHSLLVSYNVNSFNPPDTLDDATIYRPRFITVPMG